MKVHDLSMELTSVPIYLAVGLGVLYKEAKENRLPFPTVKIGQRIIVPRDGFEKATGIKTDPAIERAWQENRKAERAERERLNPHPPRKPAKRKAA